MRILIINAAFYEDVNKLLLEGAKAELTSKKIDFDIVEVPGALEIPAVISYAENSTKSKHNYDGYIALGCVIRGETSHYDIVAELSARGLMDLINQNNISIGNGILTVENKDQAIVRADINQKNKGGFAADACLKMIKIKNNFLF